MPTGIEWTEETWNPVTGCDEVSAGCKFCYAKTVAERWRGSKAFPDGFDLTFHPERLTKPLSWRKPRRIFVNSMSDLFHERVRFEYVDLVFQVIEAAPQHTFQILTKRPERMLEWSKRRGEPWPSNAWAGTSIEYQRTEPRMRDLEQVEAIRFVSAEPLLGPLVIENIERLSWLIVGGESGQHFWTISEKARQRRFLVEHAGGRDFPPRPEAYEWVRSLRDQALDAGVAFFFKQWGGPTPKVGGNMLAGKQYHEYPAPGDPALF